MNRREFLKLICAGVMTMALGKFGTVNAEKIGSKVDFHAHAILPAYIDGLKRLGIDAQAEEGFPLPKWDVDTHLNFMNDAEIDFTVLSMATPHIYNGDDKEKISREIAREINSEFASICRHYPDKFGFVATLPLPSVEGSIEEFKFAVENFGALGVKVASNSDGVYLGDKRLDPIFAELNSRKALVIMHPSPARQLPREGVVTGKVMAMYEYPADTTRAVLNMIANGTLEKFPDIKFVVPHCGSFLPYMKQRAGAMFQMLAAMKIMDAADVATGLKKFYFDLAGDPMPEQMEMLLKITDVEHLLYGSDYPYVPAQIWLKKKAALDVELDKRGWTNQIYIDNAKILNR